MTQQTVTHNNIFKFTLCAADQHEHIQMYSGGSCSAGSDVVDFKYEVILFGSSVTVSYVFHSDTGTHNYYMYWCNGRT